MIWVLLDHDLSTICYLDFSSDIDFYTKMDIFCDVISLIINQCDLRRPKGASGGHKVSASRGAQASEARL